MSNRLVAVDLPGGTRFVEALRAIWDDGDAAFVIDRRAPKALQHAQVVEFGAAAVLDVTGEHTTGAGFPVSPGDALVVATSGSSGAPKGVVHTHVSVAASAVATSSRLGVTADDRWLACLPLAHIGGLSVVTRAIVTETPVTVHDGFDADAVDSAAIAAVDPTTLVALVATALGRIDARPWRRILLGGAEPPDRLPGNVVTTYGMTETGSGIVYDGVPLEGVEVRVLDGEIHVCGPMMLRCYRDGTAPFTDDGWFATGDLGELTPDRVLSVHGRRGDLIISGGENVWPEPVERVLRAHPAVADVAVVGLPDDEWGQAVTAIIVLRPGAAPPSLNSLRARVKVELPAYCAPQQVHVVESMPRTTLGKLRRRHLATQVAKRVERLR